MKFLQFFFILIFVINQGLSSQECQIITLPNEGDTWNPDSVKVDTCSQSSTYGKWYSKKGYEFGMSIYVFGDDTLSMDTSVTWEAISSSFTQIKNSSFIDKKFSFSIYRSKYESFTFYTRNTNINYVHRFKKSNRQLLSINI